jgi:alpha-N-arabinofuranosidase
MKVSDNRAIPVISATASKDKAGLVHLSLANVDLDEVQTVTINLDGLKVTQVTGQILTSKNITDHNTFDNPDVVKLADFKDAKIRKGILTVKMPAKAIVTLEVK